MADIKIGIKRTGFPVKIGEIELWFDSSIENLKKFFNIDKLAAERLEQTKKMAESIVLPEEINEETVKAMDKQTIDDAFSVNKEFIAIQYDLIFGEGTFEKIYEKYAKKCSKLEFSSEKIPCALFCIFCLPDSSFHIFWF